VRMKSSLIGLSLTISSLFGYGFGFNISNGQESEKERQPAEIISEIRSLLNQTVSEYQSKNFTGASDLAEEAYLENYEFIEAPLEEQNETLMEQTEEMLREQLRDLVKSEGAEADVQTLVEKINVNLDQADKLLTNQTRGN
jgi:hypothetical protein